ncbi:MAG: DNA repair protein RadC [Clostridia bacterium]|nr:DNA repair protein RadC [Clostridia bacterium]
MKDENLHEGHRERLRVRAIENGLDSFNEHQVLELILSFYLPRVDTNPIAHKLIKEFGSLAKVLEAKTSDLMKVDGMGEKASAFIELIPQILKAYKKSKMQSGVCITSPMQVFDYLGDMIKLVPYEEFYLICLNSKSKVLLAKLLSKGTNNQVSLNLQQITQTALQTSASGIILVHNHPSGTSQPSAEDIILTKKVYLSLSLNGICVMDHLIIAKDDYYSFNKDGLFKVFNREFNSILDFDVLRQKAPKYEV